MKESTYNKKVATIRKNASATKPFETISIDTRSKKNADGEIINPTKEDIAKYNKKYTTIKLPTKYQKFAMSKPAGKVLDSKVGKAGVKVGNKVIKAAKAPGKLLKNKWNANQAYRNKNSTAEKFRQSK